MPWHQVSALLRPLSGLSFISPQRRSNEPGPRVSLLLFLFLFIFSIFFNFFPLLLLALGGKIEDSYRREDVFAGRGPAGVLCFKVIE